MRDGQHGIERDRLEALRGLEPAERARRLARLPMVGRLLLDPQLGAGFGRRRARAPLEDAAAILASDGVIEMTMAGLPADALALLRVAATLGGTVSRDAVILVAGDPGDGRLDAARDALVAAFLAEAREPWLVLRPGVLELVPTLGPSVRELLEPTATSNDVVASALRALGAPLPERRRRADLVEALESALSDVAVLTGAVAGLGREAKGLLAALVEGRRLEPRVVRGYDGRTVDGWRRYARPAEIERDPVFALRELELLGLVDVDPWDGRAEAWLEVRLAVSGGCLRGIWPPHAPGVPAAVADAPAVPAAVALVDALVARWRSEPPRTLASGGVAVASLRHAATALSAELPAVRLLADVARELGLLAAHASGKGRSQTWRLLVGPAAAAWADLPAGERWARIVDAGVGLAPGTPRETILFDLLLGVLADLPEGTGLPEDGLAEALGTRCIGLEDVDVPEVVVALRTLGLAPPTGPVGLTATARAVLSSPTEGARLVDEAAAAGGRILIQADHTVVAPPDAPTDVVLLLDRIATLESSGAARVYRLDGRRVAAEIAAGRTTEAIVGALAAASAVGVPDAVRRLVEDAAAARGGLRVVRAQTVVVADDPVALASALRVRAARLEQVNATTAVSPLAEERVLSALRAKGLAPAVEGAADADARALAPARTLDPLPPTLVPGAAAIAARLA